MSECRCGRETRDDACEGMVERFLGKVERRGHGDCWPYRGTILSSGYGQISHGRDERWLAHRLAWTIAYGAIPNGMTVDHVRARGCTRKDCVNPAHLEVVTMQENLRRSNAWSAVNSRKEACPDGHEYDQIRTRPDGRTYRRCSTCYNAWQRSRRAQRRDAVA